jgi:FkbM family methyltransferase
MNPAFYRLLRRMLLFKVLLRKEPFHLPAVHAPLEEHGSKYGGWALLAGTLTPASIVFSVGVGEDVSFDLSVLERHKCTVFAFDPTPKAIAHVDAKVKHPGYHFHPIALAGHDGTLEFGLAGPEGDGVSASAIVSSTTATPRISVPCATLKTLFDRVGVAGCDVLKMDIEGLEYEVLEQALEAGWLQSVSQLLVEFHHWLPGLSVQQTRDIVRKLRSHGYLIAWVSRTNHEYLFVQSSVLNRIGLNS